MLVTFHSKAWSSVTLFGEVADTLLKMMGHSGAVPGALLAEEIPAAVARLMREVSAAGSRTDEKQRARPGDEDAEALPPVTLRQRAYPLIRLLSAAAEKKCDVMWEPGHPLV